MVIFVAGNEVADFAPQCRRKKSTAGNAWGSESQAKRNI